MAIGLQLRSQRRVKIQAREFNEAENKWRLIPLTFFYKET